MKSCTVNADDDGCTAIDATGVEVSAATTAQCIFVEDTNSPATCEKAADSDVTDCTLKADLSSATDVSSACDAIEADGTTVDTAPTAAKCTYTPLVTVDHSPCTAIVGADLVSAAACEAVLSPAVGTAVGKKGCVPFLSFPPPEVLLLSHRASHTAAMRLSRRGGICD